MFQKFSWQKEKEYSSSNNNNNINRAAYSIILRVIIHYIHQLGSLLHGRESANISPSHFHCQGPRLANRFDQASVSRDFMAMYLKNRLWDCPAVSWSPSWQHLWLLLADIRAVGARVFVAKCSDSIHNRRRRAIIVTTPAPRCGSWRNKEEDPAVVGAAISPELRPTLYASMAPSGSSAR